MHRATTHPQRCLLVGLGGRAERVLLPALSECDVLVAAVCDNNPTSVVAFDAARRRGWIAADAPLLDRLPADCSQFDFALVATSHATHASITRQIVAAGGAVLKEKPLARSTMEARALCSAVGGRLMPIVDRPHMPVFRATQRLLPMIGALRRLDIKYCRMPSDYRHTWRNDRAAAGDGVLLDMGYHPLDILSRLVGVGRLELLTTRRRSGYVVDEHVLARYHLPSGCEVRLEVSRLARTPIERYVFVGVDGIMHTTLERVIMRRHRGGTIVRDYHYDPISSAANMLRQALRDRHAPQAVRREQRQGMRVIAAIDAAYRGVQCLAHHIVLP